MSDPISEETIYRVENHETALYDACVICGVKPFTDCPHTVQETEAVIKRARGILKWRREKQKKAKRETQ